MEFVEQLKSSIDIVKVIGEYVRLKRQGSTGRYLGLCPFHQEKTPSFNVNQTRQFYKCFGCGVAGDALKFVMEIDGLTFPEAIKLLAERRIGAVVVLGADHRIVGILSERDIVRALAEHGPTALNKPVSQVMTRDVKTCTEDDTVEGLMGRMTTGKFRHMPVVQQGKLVGIVSIGDVVKNRVEEIEHEAATLRDYIRQ